MFLANLLVFLLTTLVYSIENCKLSPSDLTKKGFPTQEPYIFSEIYNIIELEESTGAKCLDGTNFKFYYTKGVGEGANKFMINWQAASFIGAEGIEIVESAYQKSFTVYGSSKDIGANGTSFNWTIPVGYFSNSEYYNPAYWNYNKFLILYCDGSLHHGYLEEPILHNKTNLYFRGSQNTLSVLEYAKKNLGLLNASEVILTGTSGGGLAALYWTTYLQNYYFKPDVKLFAFLDAGLFIDTYNEFAGCNLFRYYIQKLANLTNMTNSEVFKNCDFKKENNSDEFWKCLMPQYMYHSINIPVFIMNDQNDYSQLTSLNSLSCIAEGGAYSCNKTEKKIIARIREYFLDVIYDIIHEKPQWGIWARTCFEHTLAGTWAWYGNYTAFNAEMLTSRNLREALAHWYNGGELTKTNYEHYIDLIDWEHNPKCQF